MSFLTRTTLAAALIALLPTLAYAQNPQPVAKDTSAQVADTAKAVDEPLVLTGFYEIANGRGLTITLEEESLHATPSSGEKRKLIHKSGTTYAVDGTGMTLSFTLDANGLPTELVMRVRDQQRTLKKLR